MTTNPKTPTIGVEPAKMGAEPAKAGNDGPVIDQAKNAAQQLYGQTKEQIGNQLTARKDEVTDRAQDVASAIREAGQKLGDKDGAIPNFASQAAEQVEKMSRYVRGRNVGELIGDVEGFARREPAIFVGGAFALGLFAARFLKSSAHHEQDESKDFDTADTHRMLSHSRVATTPTVTPSPTSTPGMGSTQGMGTPQGTGMGATTTSPQRTTAAYGAPSPYTPSPAQSSGSPSSGSSGSGMTPAGRENGGRHL